jgi:hypothetical protein
MRRFPLRPDDATAYWPSFGLRGNLVTGVDAPHPVGREDGGNAVL